MQSLDRAFDLLEQLAAVPDGMALCELCRQTGLKAPTVHNLLRTLLRRGYVAKSAEPVRYRVGLAVQELARRSGQDGCRREAAAAVQRLAAAFPAARVTFSTMVAGEAVIRLRMAPGSVDIEDEPVGAPLSPYASASGLVFQAFGDPEAVADYCRRHPFWEHAAQLWQQPEKLEAELAGFRRRGCVDLKLRGEDLRKMAAPVRGPDGSFLGAMGAAVPGDTDTATVAALLRRLCEEAGKLGKSETTRRDGR